MFKQTQPEIFRFDSIVNFFRNVDWRLCNLSHPFNGLEFKLFFRRQRWGVVHFFHHTISDQTFPITHPESNQPQFDGIDQYHCALSDSIIAFVTYFFSNSLCFVEKSHHPFRDLYWNFRLIKSRSNVCIIRNVVCDLNMRRQYEWSNQTMEHFKRKCIYWANAFSVEYFKRITEFNLNNRK